MKTTNKLLNNYKYYLFCKSALWIAPIVTIFYLLHDLSFIEIFFIASYYKIAVAIFEVPTGAFADKYGHKKSVLLGLFIIALSLFLYPLGTTFLYFLIFETTIAVGATLISGADESLFYDSLKSIGKENEYTKIKGIAKQYTFLSQLIGSVVASLLYALDPRYPFFISGILVFVGLVIFSRFDNIIDNKNDNKDISYINQIKQTAVYVFKHKRIRTLIIYASLINMTYTSLIHTYAPYFISVGINEIYFGIIFALFNVIALLSSRYNSKYIEKTKPYSLIILGIILIASYLILGFVTIPIGILGILLQQIYRGVSGTTFTKYINKCAPSEKRATILSYFSLTSTLFGGLFGILIGIALDYTNIFNTYLILSGITLIIIIFSYFYLNRNLGRNSK